MVAHEVISDKDYVLRGATATAVDLSKFGTISGKKYGEPLDDSVCVCGFEKTLSTGQLIDFGDPVHPVMDRMEHLSTRHLVHSRMFSLFFVTNFLTA